MERKPFEITVGGNTYTLELGHCAVALFRTKQEVDYVAVEMEDGDTLRIFNNQQLARWMAGRSLHKRLHNMNEYFIHSTETMKDDDGYNTTFREVYGWNPTVIEKEEPFEWEEDQWVELNTDDLDTV